MPSTDSEILSIEFYSNDLFRTLTIGEWLVTLLTKLWDEEEGFSGKRPFGNSSWKNDVAVALIREGVIDGLFEEHTTVNTNDGEVNTKGQYIELNECDSDEFDRVMLSAITSLGKTKESTIPDWTPQPYVVPCDHARYPKWWEVFSTSGTNAEDFDPEKA